MAEKYLHIAEMRKGVLQVAADEPWALRQLLPSEYTNFAIAVLENVDPTPSLPKETKDFERKGDTTQFFFADPKSKKSASILSTEALKRL
jgi:hypothetical protein